MDSLNSEEGNLSYIHLQIEILMRPLASLDSSLATGLFGGPSQKIS